MNAKHTTEPQTKCMACGCTTIQLAGHDAACVNTLSDIPDPAAFRAQYDAMREALEACIEEMESMYAIALKMHGNDLGSPKRLALSEARRVLGVIK